MMKTRFVVLLAIVITGRFTEEEMRQWEKFAGGIALKIVYDAFRGRRERLQMEPRKGQCRDSLLAAFQMATLRGPAGRPHEWVAQENEFPWSDRREYRGIGRPDRLEPSLVSHFAIFCSFSLVRRGTSLSDFRKFSRHDGDYYRSSRRRAELMW